MADTLAIGERHLVSLIVRVRSSAVRKNSQFKGEECQFKIIVLFTPVYSNV